MSNPFQSIPNEKKPKVELTDYHKDIDKFIIEYAEVDHVKSLGEKDTDFVIETKVEEISRVDRQKSYDSYSNDVGILNIIKKVQMSGDNTLLNQTHRIGFAIDGKNPLGRDVEKVLDVSNYQVDQIEGLESFKKGAASFETLDPSLKGKKNLEQVAKMSDAEIDSYIQKVTNELLALKAKKKEEGDK